MSSRNAIPIESPDYTSFACQRPGKFAEREHGMRESVARPVRLEPPALRRAWDTYFAIDMLAENQQRRAEALARVRRILNGGGNSPLRGGETVVSCDVDTATDRSVSAGTQDEATSARIGRQVAASAGV